MKKKPIQQTPVSIKNTPFTSRNYKGVISAQIAHPHAQIPHKTHMTDIGYDVTLVERCDGKTEDLLGEVTLFDTGLRIKPPEGYYLELLPRSSLYKKGYMLVNSVGIIDPDYRGNIIAALYKFKDGDDLTLPARCMQLVLRKAEYAHMGICEEELEDTQRADGGFGSTDERVNSAPASSYDSRNTNGPGSYAPDFNEREITIPRKKIAKQQPSSRGRGGGSFYS